MNYQETWKIFKKAVVTALQIFIPICILVGIIHLSLSLFGTFGIVFSLFAILVFGIFVAEIHANNRF